MMEESKFKNILSGLYFACPMQKSSPYCPFAKFRNNIDTDYEIIVTKYKNFISSDCNILEQMYEYHRKCMFDIEEPNIYNTLTMNLG